MATLDWKWNQFVPNVLWKRTFFHFNKWWMQIPVVRKSGTFTSTFLKMWWVNTCYLPSPKERNADHLPISDVWRNQYPAEHITGKRKPQQHARWIAQHSLHINVWMILRWQFLYPHDLQQGQHLSTHRESVACCISDVAWLYKMTGNLPSANVKLTQNFCSLE
jgi:hypothetical protein